MPVIGEEVIKKIDLITADAWVTVLTNPKADTWEEVPEDQEDAGAYLMTKIIKEWNFTNSDGTPAEINEKNITQALSKFDIALISRVLGLDKLMLTDKKKDNSSSTSTKTSEVDHPQNT